MGTSKRSMLRTTASRCFTAQRCVGARWCSGSSSPARGDDAWQRNAMNTGNNNYRNNFDRIFNSKSSTPKPAVQDAPSAPEKPQTVQELQAVIDEQAQRIAELER